MPENTVCVDRRTIWGNPFKIGQRSTINGHVTMVVNAAQAVTAYEHWLTSTELGRKLFARIDELRGRNLACWCKPGETCHADVLLRWANAGGAQ